MKTHKMRGFTGCTLNLAGAFTLGVEPRMDFGQTEPSIRLRQGTSESLPVQYPHQRQQVHITRHIHRLFTVVFCRFTAQDQKPRPLEKRFIVSVLSRCFCHTTEPAPAATEYRGWSAQRGFHKVLGITIRRQPDKCVARLCSIK